MGSGREILLYNRPDTLRGIFAHKETEGGSGRLSRLHGLAKRRGTVVMGNHLLLLSTTMSIVIFIQLRSINVTVEEMGQRLTLQYYSPWLCSESCTNLSRFVGAFGRKDCFHSLSEWTLSHPRGNVHTFPPPFCLSQDPHSSSWEGSGGD